MSPVVTLRDSLTVGLRQTVRPGALDPTETLAAKFVVIHERRLPNVIASGRPESRQEGKSRDATEIHRASRRRGGRLGAAARGQQPAMPAIGLLSGSSPGAIPHLLAALF
jgi:hypothetical protein